MAGLSAYCLRRVVQLLPAVFGILLVNFVLIKVAPGDPVQLLAGDFAASPEYVAKIRSEFALDRPLWAQAAIYFGRALRGDFGYSIAFGQPVSQLIGERLGPSLLLSCSAILLAVMLGIGLGVMSARHPDSLIDRGGTVLALLAYSVPVFWLGQLLLILFALQFRWFPVQGMASLRTPESGIAAIIDIAHHLALPALTLAGLQLAFIARMTRASMQEALAEDFIRTARAKGVPEWAIVFRHALRNALLPVITAIGMNVGTLAAGAVLTETVFGWPGLGRLIYEAVLKRDYPVMMGMLAVISVGVVVANLLTDVAYALFDPRVRYG